MYVLYVLAKIGSLLGLSSGEDGYKLLVDSAVIADLVAYVFLSHGEKETRKSDGKRAFHGAAVFVRR